jgi:DNA-binding PadR family transcriptional regulator
VLLALADGARHGYAIMQDVAARTAGQVRLWPAALYGAGRELEELDYIAETEVCQLCLVHGRGPRARGLTPLRVA